MIEEIQKIIIEHLEEQGKLFGRSFSIPLNSATPLLGERSEIDSMGLVLLIVDVEQAIHAKFGRAITLVNERAMASRSSPFRDVARMAQYAANLVGEAAT